MPRETQQVASVNEEFYGAFESLDIKRMEKIWAKEGYVQCLHPGWRMLRGWEAVMTSWRRIFENTREIRFMLSDVSVQVKGSFAWVTLYENISSPMEGEMVSGIVAATNIFEKTADGWRIVHHQGSTVAQHPTQFNPSTVH